MVFNPEYDAKQALQIANSEYGSDKYNDYCVIYRFTSENISGLFSDFSFEGKKVLTVCSSGDHLLNGIFLGAKHVDCFDINILTKYYTELKIAAIKRLSLEEFVYYFMEKGNIQEIYNKLKNELSSDTKTFGMLFFKYFVVNVTL